MLLSRLKMYVNKFPFQNNIAYKVKFSIIFMHAEKIRMEVEEQGEIL